MSSSSDPGGVDGIQHGRSRSGPKHDHARTLWVSGAAASFLEQDAEIAFVPVRAPTLSAEY